MRITDRKPVWLNKRINLSDCSALKGLINDLRLNTVCQEARCPNIGECFAGKQATFLLLGDTCTRSCRFCAVKRGLPKGADQDEPERVAEAVQRLGLRHVVLTSVTRDDLTDGGSSVFASTVLAIKRRVPGVSVEVLVPDFMGKRSSIKDVVDSGADIIAHNLETVPDLYHLVRSDSDYRRSLNVLRMTKDIRGDVRTKSGIMLGLGESLSQVMVVLDDLREARCDFLSIGQYLAPSLKHYSVKRYVPPEEFAGYKKMAEQKGFLYVESGPYVRSSYSAQEYLNAVKTC